MNTLFLFLSSIVVSLGNPTPPNNFNILISNGKVIHLMKSEGRQYRKIEFKLTKNDQRTNVKLALKKLEEVEKLDLDDDKDKKILQISRIVDNNLELDDTNAILFDADHRGHDKWFYIQLDYENRSYRIEGWNEDVASNLIELFKEF